MSQAHGHKPSDVEFTPYQEQFLRGDKRFLGFVSGVGAGKTFIGNWRTWFNMEEWNQGEMGAIVAPTRQMIVNVILPEMRELGFLERWDYNSSYADEPGLHSPNGSRALLLSADNKKTIERLRGLNLAWWHIDERTAVDQRAQQILEQRLRTGNYRNGYITTTPKGKDDTYEFFVKQNGITTEVFGDATLYEGEDRLAIVGVPTGANPHTPEDYKVAMKQDMPEDIRAQEVQGRFVEIGSGIFKPDMFEYINPYTLNEEGDHWQTIIGVDPAVQADSTAAQAQDSDYWGMVVITVNSLKNTIYVTDTGQRRGLTLQEGVNWLSSVARNASHATMVVESNQSQRFLTQSLSNAGIKAQPTYSTTDKEDRLIDLSVPISNGHIKFVDWSCQDTSEDYTPGDNHPYDGLVQEALAFPEGSHDDLLDALYLAVDNAPANIGNSILTADPYSDDNE